ncbi:hypothetical protein [Nonomuraea sp. NPDC049709]|uniref:hypothetical protein n=1 Tax=Nonomuraea sp. NPDC049709 TaxID=3154736 RepID=UPI00341D23A1
MNNLKRPRAMAVAAAVLTAAGIMLPTGATADAAQQAKSADCYVNLGTLTFGAGGRNIGGYPPRYEFDASPYLGAIYDSCAGTMKVYYGGYKSTHYNIRGYGNQREVPGGLKRVTTWRVSGSEPRAYPFTVQACNRGSGLGRSRCTQWSPTVWLQVNAEVVR